MNKIILLILLVTSSCVSKTNVLPITKKTIEHVYTKPIDWSSDTTLSNNRKQYYDHLYETIN